MMTKETIKKGEKRLFQREETVWITVLVLEGARYIKDLSVIRA